MNPFESTFTLDLIPYKVYDLPVNYIDEEGKSKELVIKLRGFPLADASWLEAECGKDWMEKVLAGNLHLAIRILIHQIENFPEVSQAIGDPAKMLPKLISRREENVTGIITLIARMYTNSRPESKAKKKTMKAAAWILTTLLAFCSGVLAADSLMPIFLQ